MQKKGEKKEDRLGVGRQRKIGMSDSREGGKTEEVEEAQYSRWRKQVRGEWDSRKVIYRSSPEDKINVVSVKRPHIHTFRFTSTCVCPIIDSSTAKMIIRITQAAQTRDLPY